MASPIEAQIIAFLRRNKAEGAFWTGDIAAAIRQPTTTVRQALVRMEAALKVEKVVVGGKGQPSSWKLATEQELTGA